jgi:hypothetical protein
MLVRLGMAPQPLPGGPPWRACRDVAAADLAGHLDPQDDRHFGTPRRPDLHVAAFGRYLTGVDHKPADCSHRPAARRRPIPLPCAIGGSWPRAVRSRSTGVAVRQSRPVQATAAICLAEVLEQDRPWCGFDVAGRGWRMAASPKWRRSIIPPADAVWRARPYRGAHGCDQLQAPDQAVRGDRRGE